jgi:enamine deaminase RidA (YjgF/YER057c/UK114 family)
MKELIEKNIQHINPEGLMKNPAFSQVVITQGTGRTIYIGGQNAVNAGREIVGKGSLSLQTEQAMKNIQTALTASGATFDNVIKLNIYIVQGQNAGEAFKASQAFIQGPYPPAITVLFVAGLSNADFLFEIDAVAFQGGDA